MSVLLFTPAFIKLKVKILRKDIARINALVNRVINQHGNGTDQQNVWQVVNKRGGWYSPRKVYKASLSFKRYCLETGTGSSKPFIVSQ